MKITTKFGDVTVAALNDALLAKAATAKLLRVSKVHADTTVVPAAVAYPDRLRAVGQGRRTDLADRGADQGRRRGEAQVPEIDAAPQGDGPTRSPGS